MGANNVDILSATEASTTVHCSYNIETIQYQGVDDTGKRWRCPSGSSGRYVYLLYEDPNSDPGLTEVEVYAVNASISAGIGGFDLKFTVIVKIDFSYIMIMQTLAISSQN